jgi:hypothetical protein
MYKSKKELLDAYSKWNIVKISETLYSIQGHVHKIIDDDGNFSFKCIE